MTTYQSSSYFKNFGNGYTAYKNQKTSLKMTFESVIRNLRKKLVLKGDALEVGSGLGYLGTVASKYFNKLDATEYSSEGYRESRLNGFDNVFQGGVREIPSDLHYDYIFAMHVIEHVYDPLNFLNLIRHKLRNGGKLVLTTPPFHSMWRKILGVGWPSIKCPEHVSFFEKESLKQLLTKAGFKDLVFFSHKHFFPIELILEKIGLKNMGFLRSISVWIPDTSFGVYATK